jgi:tetratricopeptide (TPR) repeat protein
MSSQSPRVSLCMIVRDEERNLADCLTPVAELFDEIVIVDTGSRDRTKDIARQFTLDVHDFEWCDNFSAARNEGLKHATGDWIFWLDADDRIRPEHLPELRRLIACELTDWPRVFLMNVLLLGSRASDEPGLTTHPRLFRRGDKVRWKGRVHEQLQLDYSTPCEHIFSSVQIEHIGYQDATRDEARTQRNLPLMRLDLQDDPNNPNTLLQLGYALSDRDPAEARRHLQRLVGLERGRGDILQPAYCLLTEIALNGGEIQEAIGYVSRGLELFPDDPRLLYQWALVQFAVQDYAEAASLLERAIRQPPARRVEYGTARNVQSKIAPRMLASIRRLQQHFREAEQLLVNVLNQFPDDVLSWYNLGLVYVDEVRLDPFAEVVRKLLSMPQGSIEGGLLTALWYLRHGDPAAAGPIIEQLLAEAPDRPQPWMLRAELLSRLGAAVPMQIESLREVLRLEPHNAEAKGWLMAIEKAQKPGSTAS